MNYTSPRSYDWYANDGANSITVTNAVNTSNANGYKHTYSRTYTLTELTTDEDTAYDKFKTYYEAIINQSSVTVPYIGTTQYDSQDSFVSWLQKDMVLLTLDEEIPHSTGAILTTLFDEDTETHNVAFGANFEVMGWGTTETGSQSSTLREVDMSYDIPAYNHTGLYAYDSTDSEAKMGSVQCSDSQSYCYAHRTDYISLSAQADLAYALPGDSGTATVVDGKFVGVLSTYNSYYTTNQYAFFDYYMPSIISAINTLIVPSDVTKSVDADSTDSINIEIPIQNFTDSTMTINPTMVSSDNESMIPLTIGGDCGTTLESGEGCTISITANPDNDVITGTSTAYLDINESSLSGVASNTEIPITLTVASSTTDSDEYVIETVYGEESGSSGGSFGLFSLIGLLTGAAIRNRKLFKTNTTQ